MGNSNKLATYILKTASKPNPNLFSNVTNINKQAAVTFFFHRDLAFLMPAFASSFAEQVPPNTI